MKETKECPYCGEEILSTAKKCKHCGEWLTDNKDGSSQQEIKKIPCPVCAEMIDANSKVCPYCHEPLQCSNEPLQCSNEPLQCSNEPLHQEEEIKPQDVAPAVDATPKETSHVDEVTDTTPESLSGFFKSYFWDPYVVHLFDFKGKISRKQYWMGALACTIVAVILGFSILLAAVIELAFLTIILAIPGILFLFIAQIGAISTTVRRFNDIGKSPLWYFVAIVPVVGTIYLIYLLAQKGETSYPKVKHNRLDLAVIGYVVLAALVVFIQDMIATSI